jgi:hypothetical protein
LKEQLKELQELKRKAVPEREREASVAMPAASMLHHRRDAR